MTLKVVPDQPEAETESQAEIPTETAPTQPTTIGEVFMSTVDILHQAKRKYAISFDSGVKLLEVIIGQQLTREQMQMSQMGQHAYSFPTPVDSDPANLGLPE